jgi:hypothetical protein
MKIGVFPADLAGCGHYRLLWPAEQVKALGYDVTIIMPDQRKSRLRAQTEDDNVTKVFLDADFDIIVLQRTTHKFLAQAVPFLREMGVAVVVDMDDDLETIHPSNPAWTALHPRSRLDSVSAQHSWHWAKQACADATLVTITSEALKQRYRPRGLSYIIRNYIPERVLKIPHEDSNVFGWAGSLHSHPDDLTPVGSSIARLINEGHRFKVVGAPNGIARELGMREDPEHTGPTSVLEWPERIAELGIGIAPLADTKFNAAKSWLKPLEYAAAGVPAVVSPRIEYRELHKLGIGIMADKPKHWYTKIKNLVTDDVFRQEESARVREIAATLTVEENAWRWAEAWSKAVDSN